MRVVCLHTRIQGEVLAMPVHGDGGRLLLNKGTRLTPRLIEVLLQRGYTRVAIEDPLLEDVEPEEAVSEETRSMAERALDMAAKKLLDGRAPDMGIVRDAVDAIIEDLKANKRTCVGVYSLRSYDESTFIHSVNVCVLSLAIAETMGYSVSEMRILGLGALLHDIGKLLVPTSILRKPGMLTDEEYELVKTHAKKGWELLANCYAAGPVAAHGALDHHERLDGSGYPRKLKGDEISEIGRVTAVADVYDAMTSDRPQRKAIFPEAVYKYMDQEKGTLFDSQAVDALFQRVALYPTGTILSLWGGFVAVVTRQDPRSNFRPFIRIVGGPGITKPVDVSLYDRPDIEVNLVLDDYPSDAPRILPNA